MISYINGKIKRKTEECLFIDVNGIVYEVLIPKAIMNVLENNMPGDSDIELVTYHYLHVEPSRSKPILIGFLNEIEREFFEQFITVSGVGPKAAVRALSLPISVIAEAIDSANFGLLKTLPGIGQQRAREIVAKLQGKVGKFCLIQDRVQPQRPSAIKEDIQEEAMAVLLQLQYKRNEAKEMIKKAIETNPEAQTPEEILNQVYRQKTKEPEHG
ncbi:MAG: Holliday junction DNA helicase RuvA [Candidatus Omnitrophica bacterium]|nr:Holliday junction DNA helicase RuvA [Candidatus Omnitrophota bacterium]